MIQPYQVIQEAVQKTIKELFNQQAADSQIQIQPTRKEFEGEFTLVVFPLLKISKNSPEKTGELIGEKLMTLLPIQNYSVVKGFLNLKMKTGFWTDHLKQAYSEESYGFRPSGSKPLVMVEYSSPNTNKPLHLGHLRNIFLGYSVSEILKAFGHEVKKVQIINDRGIHICKSMVAWQKFGNGESPESSGLKGDHLVGKYYVRFNEELKKEISQLMEKGLSEDEAEVQAPLMQEARETLKKWESRDPEVYALWEKLNGWVYEGFDQTYKTMGVDFDKLYYESDTWSIGKEKALKALDDGVFYKKEDGSVWVDLSADGLDEKLILRKDGTAVYMTQDIGTAIIRYEEFPGLSKMVYTVGNEQEYHFKVLFLILEKLGYEWAKDCHHLSYGMVELPEGKMKSREGTVVDADDLMNEMVSTAQSITTELGKLDGLESSEKEELYTEIGLGALKYFLLRVDPRKNMLFDPKESIDFNGHTGPFIQYAHARIQSLLRNAGEVVIDYDLQDDLSAFERNLHMKILDFPEIIKNAAQEYNPALLANYLYETAKEFGSFYQNVPILKAETQDQKNYRILLSAAVGRIIKSGMALLGIDVPDRM
jgi:arginyl-tRNA synthetase